MAASITAIGTSWPAQAGRLPAQAQHGRPRGRRPPRRLAPVLAPPPVRVSPSVRRWGEVAVEPPQEVGWFEGAGPRGVAGTDVEGWSGGMMGFGSDRRRGRGDAVA